MHTCWCIFIVITDSKFKLENEFGKLFWKNNRKIPSPFPSSILAYKAQLLPGPRTLPPCLGRPSSAAVAAPPPSPLLNDRRGRLSSMSSRNRPHAAPVARLKLSATPALTPPRPPSALTSI